MGTLVACGDTGTRRLPNEDERPPAESLRPAPAPGAVADSAVARPKVLIVGTSLTAGLGLDPEDAYPAILQRMADSAGYRVDVIAAGVSGETSAGALRRIDWLLQRDADVIVIETGANDGLRGLDVDSTRANLREILRRARAAKPGAQLFLVQMEAPPNLGQRYTTAFGAMFPEVARDAGAGLIPFLLDGVAAVPELNQPDGIHPNSRGSLRVAANVWPSLKPTLRNFSSPRWMRR
jgi:acyl-CoA thioesterase-1